MNIIYNSIIHINKNNTNYIVPIYANQKYLFFVVLHCSFFGCHKSLSIRNIFKAIGMVEKVRFAGQDRWNCYFIWQRCSEFGLVLGYCGKNISSSALLCGNTIINFATWNNRLNCGPLAFLRPFRVCKMWSILSSFGKVLSGSSWYATN